MTSNAVSRKRTRNPSANADSNIPNSPMDPIEEPNNLKFLRERQKEYSRKNRRRQKEHVKVLEKKVYTLEAEVQRLNYELWAMKNENVALASGLKSTATELIQTEVLISERLRS